MIFTLNIFWSITISRNL